MKSMRLWIIALTVSVLLCGCATNNIAPTDEVLNTDVTSAISSDETPTDSNISFSEGEASLPETSSEPTESPTNDTATSTTTSRTQTSNNSQGTTSNSSNQTQTPPTSSVKPPEKTTNSEPKSAFAKPYDTGTMKSDLISYGTSIGMTHITKFSEDFGGGEITPTGTTWLPPVETWHYGSNSADKLKQDICYDIQNWKNKGESTYTLWFEKDSSHTGEYIIYVIIG